MCHVVLSWKNFWQMFVFRVQILWNIQKPIFEPWPWVTRENRKLVKQAPGKNNFMNLFYIRWKSLCSLYLHSVHLILFYDSSKKNSFDICIKISILSFFGLFRTWASNSPIRSFIFMCTVPYQLRPSMLINWWELFENRRMFRTPPIPVLECWNKVIWLETVSWKNLWKFNFLGQSFIQRYVKGVQKVVIVKLKRLF